MTSVDALIWLADSELRFNESRECWSKIFASEIKDKTESSTELIIFSQILGICRQRKKTTVKSCNFIHFFTEIIQFKFHLGFALAFQKCLDMAPGDHSNL